MVIQKLERIRTNFFWGTQNNLPKIPCVAWDKLINNKEKGGLGIGSLKSLNVALLPSGGGVLESRMALFRKK